jgi:hypothetical protein
MLSRISLYIIASLISVSANAAIIVFSYGPSNQIHRFDAITGEALGAIGSTYNEGGLTYGDGVLFSYGPSNQIHRFDAITGEALGAIGSTYNVGGLTYGHVVPIPSAAWLFCSALLGLFCVQRK